jgi:hypothetical protein
MSSATPATSVHFDMLRKWLIGCLHQASEKGL